MHAGVININQRVEFSCSYRTAASNRGRGANDVMFRMPPTVAGAKLPDR